MNPQHSLLLPLLLLLAETLVFPSLASARTVTENIFFLKPDGKSYLNYSTTRSDHESYNLFLRKDESEDQFDYIYPNDYTFDSDTDPERNVITFTQGSYATLRPGSFAPKIETETDGTFSFINWKEGRDEKLPGGFHGEWTSPDNFDHYVYAWVLPENLEILSFETNRKQNGVWRARRNTLAWFGKDVNNLVFKIRYRTKASEAARNLQSNLLASTNNTANNQVSITAGASGVRVVLSDQVLFPSGSAELGKKGRAVLNQLAASLTATTSRFIVEGHSDNQPIGEALKERYPSNWELSAARSLAVVKHLESSGIPGSRLESRSYGSHRPIAKNDTIAGRAENRRIEIHIVSP